MMSHSGTARLQGYLRVARAPFLALPVTLVILGSAAAAVTEGFDPLAAFLAFLGLVSLHVSVNARNEYRDHHSGVDHATDPTPFSGGSKTLPEGDLEPTAAKRLAATTAGIGAIIGGYFLVEVGLSLLPLVAIGAVSVLFYTSHLARYGLGELFAGLGLGGLPVVGTALVQVGSVTPAMLLAGIPATFLTFNLLLLNEFPDQEADKVGGRANLIHRLGRPKAAILYAIAALAVPGAIIAGWAVGSFPLWAIVGVVPSLLLVRPLRWAFSDPESSVPVAALRDNVLWILATNVFLGVGLLLPLFV